MKGLSNLPKVYDHLLLKEKNLETVNLALRKEKEQIKQNFDKILKTVTDALAEAYSDIVIQIDKFQQYYEHSFNLLEKEIDKNFKESFLSKWESFDDLLNSLKDKDFAETKKFFDNLVKD